MQKKTKIIAVIFVIIIIGVIGMWSVDIGASAKFAELSGYEITVTNGWWFRSPDQQYHTGLAMILVALLTLSLITLYSVNGEL